MVVTTQYFIVTISVVYAMVTFASVYARPRLRKKGKETGKQSARNLSHPHRSHHSPPRAPPTKSYRDSTRSCKKNMKRKGSPSGTCSSRTKSSKGDLADKERELEEAGADAEELANLVRTRDEAIKILQNKLADAKKTIAGLKTELEMLRRSDQPQQQQQQQRPNRVSAHSLAGIHQRYQKVLSIQKENDCSMANAFWLADCPRSTLRDFVAIAELKIVDSREHELVIRDLQGKSVKELEAACRKRLRRYIPVLSNMR